MSMEGYSPADGAALAGPCTMLRSHILLCIPCGYAHVHTHTGPP